MRTSSLLLVAATSLLAFQGCAPFCCDTYCSPSPCRTSCRPVWSNQIGEGCDRWMDCTDICVDGFCQQSGQVRGLLQESYRSSRQTLKQLHSCDSCNNQCEKFDTCSSCNSRPRARRPVFQHNIDIAAWKPKWNLPWKKSGSCSSCGASKGTCGPACQECGASGSCGSSKHDHPAGYSYSSDAEQNFESYPLPSEEQAFDSNTFFSQAPATHAPGMPSPQQYFAPPENEYQFAPQAGPQFGAAPLQPHLPPMAPPLAPPAQEFAETPIQQLPPPLPENSPRSLQWRAVSTYRESFPAPPAADGHEPAPLRTPSQILGNPPAIPADEFEAPLIIDSK